MGAKFKSQECLGGGVVFVSGRLDSNAASALQRALLKQTSNRAKRILLDLEKVDRISSECLRVLLNFAIRLERQEGVSLVAVAPSPAVRETFIISGIDSLIPLHADKASALGEAPPALGLRRWLPTCAP